MDDGVDVAERQGHVFNLGQPSWPHGGGGTHGGCVGMVCVFSPIITMPDGFETQIVAIKIIELPET